MAVQRITGSVDAAATAGALWLSAADTYVDLWQPHDAATGTGGGDGWESHWASEGGAMELVLLPGPSPAAVLAQLAALSGRPPQPPLC